MNDTLARRVERQVGGLVRFVGFVALAGVLGAAAGLVWWLATPLPTYTKLPNGGLVVSQSSMTSMVAADAWYCLIGLVGGALIGVAAWRLFRDIGWTITVIAVVAALAAGLLCWWTGHRAGPSDFAQRLVQAPSGALLEGELTLRARVAVLVWPFAAVLPVLFGSALGRDPEAGAAVERGGSSRNDPTSRIELRSERVAPARRRVEVPRG